MKPVLLQFRLGDFHLAVPSYGTAVMLGFALATWLAIRQADRLSRDPRAPVIPRSDLLDLAFYILVFGLLGSRLLFVLLNAGDFTRLCLGSGNPRPFSRAASDCLAPLKVWDGGLVFYGGLLAAAAVTARFVRRRGWRFGVVGDLFAPAWPSATQSAGWAVSGPAAASERLAPPPGPPASLSRPAALPTATWSPSLICPRPPPPRNPCTPPSSTKPPPCSASSSCSPSGAAASVSMVSSSWSISFPTASCAPPSRCSAATSPGVSSSASRPPPSPALSPSPPPSPSPCPPPRRWASDWPCWPRS